MTLGQRLKTYREKEGLTQEQLAEYLNVSRQAVTKWEHDAGMPDIENLVAISRRMGVTLDELVLEQTASTATRANASAIGSRDAFAVAQGNTPAPEHGTDFSMPAGIQQTIWSPDIPSAASNAAPAAQDVVNVPAAQRRSGTARRHAFAALALFAACICHSIAGFVNLVALSTLHTPFLPLLNFGTAALSLWAAAVQALRCSQSSSPPD
ncbi:MAG: helix-turn-helix transcriptional regulator [Subdoligranulum sp.]|nr:helix-turn-helix transcriptional regulator [Subdoligranulum sp.]